MEGVNVLAVGVAAIAAFVAASVYYAVFGQRLAEFGGAGADSQAMPAWLVPVELLRSLVVAAVLAGLASMIRADGFGDGASLGMLLWVGFPVVLLVGSVVHEKVRWQLAAIHAGDWLVKLLLVAAIVTLWR